MADCEVLDIVREIHGIDDCLCVAIFVETYSHMETMNNQLCRHGKTANLAARINQSRLNVKSAGLGKEFESRFLDPHGVSTLSIKLYPI